MNKNLCAWIEGDGTFRTLFRKLALWEYVTQKSSKLQLSLAVEKENSLIGPYLLHYTIAHKKRGILWISFLLPLSAFLVTSGLVLYFSVQLNQGAPTLYKGIVLAILILISFRITFYDQYLKASKFIAFAGDELLKELIPQKQDATKICITKNEDPDHTNAVTKTIPFAPLQTNEAAETIDQPGKGTINTILLCELIKRECKYPNIYNGDIHQTIAFYCHITGCKEKNFLDKTKHYKSRETLDLGTPNSRATHRKYLERLLEHFHEIGDDVLYKQAEDLQTYIEGAAIRKKG